jgi:DNA repair exonuclease SbcCD nuclease subunit
MPRLLHMSDVHLGARYRDLGPAAARQRERQMAAFRRAIDAAIEQDVDAVLICGDLFDSNAQPRRLVQDAAHELGRLAAAGIRSVLIPGTHDCYEPGSIYQVFDLREEAGLPADTDLLTVLTPDVPDVVFHALDLVVYGRVSPTKTLSRSPLAGFATAAESRARWKVAMIHGSRTIPGKVERDDVLFTDAEVAASGLDYLALGHWHSFTSGTAGSTTWAYAGAPEPVALDQDGAGQVLLVELALRDGKKTVELTQLPVGRTRFQALDIDAATITSQAALTDQLRAMADPDLVLDVRLLGVSSDRFDLDATKVAEDVGDRFLRIRVRDLSKAALPEGPLPPPDTIAGAFLRDLEGRIEAAEATGDEANAADAREILRLGRLLLEDASQVTLA